MATEINRRLTPIIIRSRHFSETETEETSSTNSDLKSKRNHVEFDKRFQTPTNQTQRRESFFQHYLRRFSGSSGGGGNLLTVRTKPSSITSKTCFLLATPNSSSSADLQQQQLQKSTIKDDHEKDNNDNAVYGSSKRIIDRRLQAPRLSLLGRPITYRSFRTRNVIYRIYQVRFYNFLERPNGCLAFFYHLFM